MTPPTDKAALQAAADLAQAAADRAETAALMAALSAADRARRAFDITKIVEIEAEPEPEATNPAALMLAARHLGLRPLVAPDRALYELAQVAGVSPESVTEHLRAVGTDPNLFQLMKRAAPQGDRDTVCVLAGLILARVRA